MIVRWAMRPLAQTNNRLLARTGIRKHFGDFIRMVFMLFKDKQTSDDINFSQHAG
jgi:hypothetical protein